MEVGLFCLRKKNKLKTYVMEVGLHCFESLIVSGERGTIRDMSTFLSGHKEWEKSNAREGKKPLWNGTPSKKGGPKKGKKILGSRTIHETMDGKEGT